MKRMVALHQYSPIFVFRIVLNNIISCLIFKKRHIDFNKIECLTSVKGFEAAYHLYSKKMYLICHSKIGDVEVSREIVQDIFKSIWERKDTITVKSSVENYLMGALKLKIIDYFRSEFSHKKHLKCVFEDYCEHDNCTENSIQYNDLQGKINQLVDTLPCQCRNVYKLSKEEGLSLKEIASKLLISERAVTYHLTKATSFLKKELAEYNL